jgi:putative aldouronate transport system substrate-binding protein
MMQFNKIIRTITACTVLLMLNSGGISARGNRENDATGNTEGPVTVKFLQPGDPPIRGNEVIDAVNQKLTVDKNIKVELIYIPNDIWDERINLMLTTGDEFDIFRIREGRVPSFQGMGGLTDITDIIEHHGQNIKKVISPGNFDAMRVNDRIYGIPAQWMEPSQEGVITIRMDMIKKYNLSLPKTAEDLLKITETAAAGWDGPGKLYIPTFGAAAANPVTSHLVALHRTYPSFPFLVNDSLIYIDKDGNAKSWIETEEFKKDAQWMRSAYTRGLLHPDLLTLQTDQGNNIFRSGAWIFSLGCNSYYEDIKKNYNPDITMDDYVGIKLNPEKSNIVYAAVKNQNGVSSTSRHPNEAIMFFDWLYTNQENHNLFMYGREGLEYNMNPNGTRVSLRDPAGKEYYRQSDWANGNLNFTILTSTTLPMEKKWLYTPNPDAVYFPGCDFFFDASAVEAEWVNVRTQFAASIAPVYLGVLDYDQAFPGALRQMKAAGLDKVVTEYQRQLRAHLSSKK